MNQEINPNPCTRSSSTSSSSSSSCMLEKKSSTREGPKEQLNCPRCKSNNTKFCYYNNYSLTQPRYFCKSCRRYWTEGGSLRNVPVGGGSRKNRKSSSSSAAAAAAATTTTMSSPSSSSSSSSDHFKNNHPKLPNYLSSQFSTQNYPVGRDLNLAFPCAMSHNVTVEVPKVVENINNSNNHCGIGFRGLSSFIPNLMPNSNNEINNNLGINSSQLYPSGLINSFPLREFEPSLGINNNSVRDHHHGFGDGRDLNLVAFQELNQNSSAAPNEFDHHQDERLQGNNNISTGFWSGMLGGGSL